MQQHVDLSDREVALCRQYFEPEYYHKNQVIEQEGQIPQYLYFVVDGFVRLFHFDEKGNEVTTHINCPPGFITSYSHFTRQSKSDDNLACITECKLLRINKAHLDDLVNESPAFKDFSFLVFQQSLLYNENRTKELATLSAEQRYLKLMKEYPEIIRCVPIQYIASFLGMNAKSLSRIRKNVIR